MAHIAQMSRLIPIGNSQVVSNVPDTANDYSATYAYSRGDEVSYNGRVYVNLVPSVIFVVPLGSANIDTLSNRILWMSHGISNGSRVAMRTAGTLPNPISATTLYFAVNVNKDSFQLSTTNSTANTIDITTVGSGDMTVIQNPTWGIAPDTDSSVWLNSRAINKLRMFDDVSVTATTNATSIITQVTPGARFDGIDFFAMKNVSEVIARVASVGASHTNNWLYSEEIDNAAWTKSSSTVITANATKASNGAMTADKVVENTNTSGTTTISQASAVNPPAGSTVTVSFEGKPAERSWTYIETVPSVGATLRTWFNLSTGAIGTTAAGHTPTITPTAEGFYRCSVAATQGTAGAFTARVGLSNADNVTTYTRSSGSGAYITRLQFDPGALTTYIPTTSAAVTTTLHTFFDRGYDLTETAWTDSWYNSTYTETVYKDRLSITEIPPTATTNVAFITLVGTNVECGSCLFGLSRDIGGAIYGADVGIDNWSRITRDDWGGVQIDATRGYSDNASYQIWFNKSKAAAFRRMLADYKDTPAVYRMARSDIDPSGWDALGSHHAIASFRIVMEGPCGYLCRLELEGIT